MAVLVFASSKGGCAKSTNAILAGTEFAHLGIPVFMLDADLSNQSLVEWQESGNVPPNITVFAKVDKLKMVELIEKYDVDGSLVIIDLEGITADTVWLAIKHADLVLVPMEAKFLDYKIGKKTLNLLEQVQQNVSHNIKYAVVFTKTGYIPTKAEMKIRSNLKSENVEVLDPPLMRREAYSSLFEFGGDLRSLPETGNMTAAIKNAEGFTNAIIEKMRKD